MKTFGVFLLAYACFAAGFMTSIGVHHVGWGRFAMYYCLGLGISMAVLLLLFKIRKSRAVT